MEQAKNENVEITKIERLERPKNYKSRAYFLTTWNNDNIPIEKGNLVYGCKCEDISPKTGKYHNHLFLYFKNPISFKTIQSLYGDEIHSKHVESNSGCIAYILDPKHKKASTKFNRQEFGKRPMDNGVNRCKTKEALIYTDEQIMELGPREAACVLNIKEKFRKENMWNSKLKAWKTKKNQREPIEVIYHTGESGTGKTWEIDNLHEEADKKGLNGLSIVYCNGEFWDIDELNTMDGLHEPHIMIINEFRDSAMRIDTFLQMLEGRGCIPIKQGSIPCAFLKKIVICSIIKPWKLYTNARNYEKINDELKRRITKIIEHKKIDGQYYQKEIKWPEI